MVMIMVVIMVTINVTNAHSSPECVQLYKSGDLRYVTVIVQGMGSAQHAGDRQVVDHQDVDHHDVDHYDQH